MTNSGLLERNEVAKALELSADRTGKLARKLEQEDVKGILDQRQGQKQDYRFTPEIKAQLIQQFVIEAADQHPAGAEQLAKKLKQRCQLNLSARSILSHLSKLGLPGIRDSLYEHLTETKKKSSKSSEKKRM
jgi:repressor of nif and glnA expression